MRTIKHYFACCALVSCAAAVPLESAAQYDHGKENTLRIATYNIYNGKTVDAKSYNYDKQAGIIESINPDIIAIEEVDSASARSNNRYALGQYAGYLGMRAFYSPTIDLEGGKYGMGLLAKNKPLAVKRIKLPGREEVRTAVIAEYPNYVFCGTHFSLNDDDRISSIRILCAEAEKYNKPFFLAGDLNTDLKQPSGKLLQQEFKILNDVKKKSEIASLNNSSAYPAGMEKKNNLTEPSAQNIPGGENWQTFNTVDDFLRYLERTKKALIEYSVRNDISIKEFSNGRIVMNIAPQIQQDFIVNLHKILSSATGKQWEIEIEKGEVGETIAAKENAAAEAKKKSVAEYPLVKKILEEFKGARIETVVRKKLEELAETEEDSSEDINHITDIDEEE